MDFHPSQGSEITWLGLTSQANGSEPSALPWSGDVPNRLDAGEVWPEFSAAWWQKCPGTLERCPGGGIWPHTIAKSSDLIWLLVTGSCVPAKEKKPYTIYQDSRNSTKQSKTIVNTSCRYHFLELTFWASFRKTNSAVKEMCSYIT